MNKFNNKYRIESARLPHWDYRKDAAYFITICTKNREHFFGAIENGKMKLSGVGILADVFWYEITNHTQYVELGKFIVMPNHVHGILILNRNEINDTETLDGENADALHNDPVETLHATSLPPQSPSLPPHSTPNKNQFYSNISPKPKSVSTILRSYKSAVTKHVNRLGICRDFGWQERFYDHIIRDESEYIRIEKYIENNTNKWNEDKFFS